MRFANGSADPVRGVTGHEAWARRRDYCRRSGHRVAVRKCAVRARLDAKSVSASNSALLDEVVLPAMAQAERTFAAALARISIEDLMRRADAGVK